jgi:hypothetical protein
MFPDPELKWHPLPSVMDGMKAPPFAFSDGTWSGNLKLIISDGAGTRIYGVEVIDCQIYAAFDEMIYSIADHGNRGGRYDGGVYIKEAHNSNLLNTFSNLDPMNRKPRHFLFVGGDYCFETIGFGDPVVHSFGSYDDAYAWSRNREEAT